MEGRDIIFLLFALLTVGGAFMVAFVKKITYQAFSLMLSLFGVAGIYVILSADFIAAVQVIIYIGGIIVLLLFGVLLTTKIEEIKDTALKSQRIWGTLSMAGLMVILITVFSKGAWYTSGHTLEHAPKTEIMGKLLMTDYLLPFEVASVLLLAALVGAMFIVRSEKK